MRHSSMFFALLFAPLALAAQTAAANSSPAQTAQQRQLLDQLQQKAQGMRVAGLRAASACPVGFSVNQRPDGAVIWTNSTPPTPHGPGLTITFGARGKSAPLPSAIVSATITVHGMSQRLRALPVDSSSPAADATETFSLGGDSGQPLLNPAIWTRSMSAISWVELTQLVYADGTTWHASAQSPCIARPSLFVPVAESAR
jgi:hypothetical protein